MNQYTLRLEAIPLSWDALSEQQRNAMEAASGWLVDALGSIPPIDSRAEKSRQSGPVLDRNRRSQIGFIDGDRGMGKSSVLLTLQALTTEKEFSLPTTLPEEHSARKLRDQRHDVVWLETLDMEPLSKGANLFAAILARIEKELDTRVNELLPMAAALAEPDGYSGAADKLRQLQNDVAIVWDREEGGVYEGDPSTRALWDNQAEKAGLEMNQRIGQVLEAMARARWNRKDENPLFVLPVDDFDLAPCHCLELLRLIRMITTRRLFFLVAGNTRIAESVLKLRTEGDLLSLTDGKPLDYNEVRECAAEIAANNMRKLLPPGQRVRLATLRIKEALDEIRDNTDTRNGSLRTQLDAIIFEVNQAPTDQAETSFAKFLLPDEDSIGNLTIAEWLASSPRQVLDRIEMFRQLANSEINSQVKDQGAITLTRHSQYEIDRNKRDDRLIVQLFDEIRREISEDGLLSYDLRQRLVDTFDTSVSVSLNLSYLRVEQKFFEKEIIDSTDYKLVNISPVSTYVSIESGGTFTNSAKLALSWRKNLLHRRLGISLLFAHDFVVSLWGGYLRHNSLAYKSKLGPMVEVRWKTGIEDYIAFDWQPLEWWTFRDYDRFARHWSLHVDQCEKSYSLAWLAALFEVVLNEKCEPGARGISKRRLSNFLERLIKEKPVRTARRLLRESCLEAVALLLAPESQSGSDLEFLMDSNMGIINACLAKPTVTAFSISISYLLNVHPCRQRVADLLRNKGRRAATPCCQR